MALPRGGVLPVQATRELVITMTPTTALCSSGVQRQRRLIWRFVLPLAALAVWAGHATAQEAAVESEPLAGARGSLVEDRAATKLLEAGDARYAADETAKALEIWQSVIERFPRSKVRFAAHMRLGRHLLTRERAHDRARSHFEAAAAEENGDEQMRAEATLHVGICFYEARNYGKCFSVMREVIEKFPVSAYVNQAYYYIGLGHFQLGHYSRAIEALDKVGTAFAESDSRVEKAEAGRRLFLKIEDADLAVLTAGESIEVVCQTTQGDEEIVACYPVGRNVRVVLGSLPTALGRPRPGNGVLEVRGDDRISVRYVDAQTSDRTFDRPLIKEVIVVGDALVAVTDGAFQDRLEGVVLDKGVNVQIVDADQDLSDAADQVTAVLEVLRHKTQEELDAEAARAAVQGADAPGGASAPANGESAPADEAAGAPDGESAAAPEIDPYKVVDRVQVTLTEVRLAAQARSSGTGLGGGIAVPAAAGGSSSASGSAANPAASEPAASGQAASGAAAANPGASDPAASPTTEAAASGSDSPGEDDSVHTGVFRAVVPLVKQAAAAENDVLEALPADRIRITYVDERHRGEGIRTVTATAECVEGNLGGVRVTRAQISDQELRLQTQLKTASALTNIGNRYKEFGLKQQADAKYAQALEVCEAISQEAMQLGGQLLEQTYVQLWQIYYAMDQLELAAAMAERLQREFPNSGFVDDAILQLAEVARKQGDLSRAIGLYGRLVAMQESQLRGEAQFGIAECYEEMARKATGPARLQLFDRAFQEYRKVYEGFPESGRVGEAVAKMANYYYQQKDYARAIDTFESVLANHPDARFLDVILFNYGRCLFRMNRPADARRQFDQLIAEFPESPLAAEAKKISDALGRQASRTPAADSGGGTQTDSEESGPAGSASGTTSGAGAGNRKNGSRTATQTGTNP